jgi:hypothetical protein
MGNRHRAPQGKVAGSRVDHKDWIVGRVKYRSGMCQNVRSVVALMVLALAACKGSGGQTPDASSAMTVGTPRRADAGLMRANPRPTPLSESWEEPGRAEPDPRLPPVGGTLRPGELREALDRAFGDSDAGRQLAE